MDKKNQIKVKSKERFLRSFGKRVDQSGVFVRLGYAGDRPFAGRITKNGLRLYRRKMGLLSLFALTVRGSFEKNGGEEFLSLRFGRCTPFSVFWGLWCLLLMGTGAYILDTDLSFALWFLLPGFLLALPLFWFSKKEKARLREFLQDVADLG